MAVVNLDAQEAGIVGIVKNVGTAACQGATIVFAAYDSNNMIVKNLTASTTVIPAGDMWKFETTGVYVYQPLKRVKRIALTCAS